MSNIFENQKFVVANFKQSGDLEFFRQWIKIFKEEIKNLDLKINIVLCPSYIYLDLFHKEFEVLEKNQKRSIFIGSQNVSSKQNLENTGEVGASFLKDFINFSIIGHSERKENADEVYEKYKRCMENQIIPITCFYENKKVYELENCIFAYEDPKSISKEGVFAEKNFNEIVQIVNDLKPLFENKTVLYGGSVKPDNIQSILDLEFFNGVLVGRTSLDAKSFSEIVKIVNSYSSEA